MIRGFAPCGAGGGARSVEPMTSTDTASVDQAAPTADQPTASTSTAAISTEAPTAPGTLTASPFGIASLATSIVSIVLGQWLLAIPAIVFGVIGRRSEPHRAFSTWGIVLGFVSLFGWVVLALLGVALFLPFAIGAGLLGLEGSFDALPAWLSAQDIRLDF